MKFQSLFYWMYVKNVKKNFQILKNFWFQSLFYWMYVKNNGKRFSQPNGFKVSILVLLDVCKEPLNIRKVVLEKTSFNPCFIGCM